MTLETSSPASGFDLPWLALRFVLDELPEAERVAFEDRLSDDQTAREAVAAAYTLLQTVAAQPIPQSTSARRVSRGRVAIFGIVTCALAVLVMVSRPNRPKVVVVPTLKAADSVLDPVDLVAIWSESGRVLRQETGSAGEFEHRSEPVLLADSENDLLPPDWLLAAVEYESSDSLRQVAPEPLENN